ncbi:MAG: hypothetical protein IKZ93_07305, partial [Prevotella sp.]|nr:hypothetical protein [Prevotella sp.]
QFILGIKPDYNGLLIDPCVPTTAKEFTVKRKFRGAEYFITIKNPDGVQKGVKQILFDGKAIKGNVVPAAEGKHTVEVTLG